MKKIPLTQGQMALVDDCDFSKLSKFKWYYANGYAVRNERIDINHKSGIRRQKRIAMHRYILNAQDNHYVDHCNGNRSDNRRLNIRICTCGDNQRNKPKPKNNTTGFKGVCVDKRNGKFVTRICLNNKIIYVGYFDSVKKAASAYNKAALKYHGEFANLNRI
jgi:hypothetical protein